MKLTKDIYLYLTNFVDDKTILNMLSVNKKFNNPDFFQQVIRTKYPLLIEYKDETITWRKFYVNLIFSIFMIKEKYNIEFNGQYNPIKFYKSWKVMITKYPKIKDDPSVDNNLAIRRACDNGHLDVVKYLMSLPGKIDPSSENNYSIIMASLNGHLEVVKYLISLPKEYGIDPSANNNEAIILASKYGHLEVVKYLMSLPKEYKIDPCVDNNEAIRYACQRGHLEVVKYLMSLPGNIDPSAENNAAIRWASRKGHLEVVKYLMSLHKEYGIRL